MRNQIIDGERKIIVNETDLEPKSHGSVEDFLLTDQKEFGINRTRFPRNSPRMNFGKSSNGKLNGLISR